MKFRVFILLAIFGSVANIAAAQSPNEDEAAFRSLIKQLTNAQTAYDAKALDRIFTPDYIEISPAGEFDPREKVLGFYSPEAKAAAAGVTASVTANEFSIRNYGKYAIVIVRLDFTLTANGKTLPPRSMRATFVMRKAGKTWKIASAQYTGIRPAPKQGNAPSSAITGDPGAANVLEVRLPVAVTQKGKFVSGLSMNDFQVLEDGVKQQVISFSGEQTNPPAFVGVLMDTSPSSAGKLEFSKEGVNNFIYTVVRLRKNKVAFMTFDHELKLLQDFTDKIDLLDQAVTKVKDPGKETALYDAIWQFTDERLRNSPGRHVVVVISDGRDTISRANLKDVIDLAQRTETTIFAISTTPGFSRPSISPKATEAAIKSDNVLVRMSEETGGQAFFVDDMMGFEKAFQNIAQELQSQYIITYRPTNQNYDGRPRKIEVRFADKSKRKDLNVRTKLTYRAVRSTSK